MSADSQREERDSASLFHLWRPGPVVQSVASRVASDSIFNACAFVWLIDIVSLPDVLESHLAPRS